MTTETKLCEPCVQTYLKKLIDLEKVISTWKQLDTDELLFAIGEELTNENILHMNVARGKL